MKFFSLKFRELILTVDPKTFVIESGFRVTKGMNGLFPQGLSIQFQNREFDTASLNLSPDKEQRLVKILKAHPSYGTSFVSEDHDITQADQAEKRRKAEEERQLAADLAAETNHEKPINKR